LDLKNLLYALVLFYGFLCGCSTEPVDNSDKCTADDWVGVYAGTASCAGKTETGTLTVTKTKYPDSITVFNGWTAKNVAFKNCTVEVKEDTPLFTVPVVGFATLKGKEVHLDGKIFGVVICNTILTKP
jgi:hypothetical protein